jgi:hypothetical protein
MKTFNRDGTLERLPRGSLPRDKLTAVVALFFDPESFELPLFKLPRLARILITPDLTF